MEKKRKRASFSPTMPVEVQKEKEEKNTEDTPTLRQVVEVVIEEPKHKQESQPPQINIVMPENRETTRTPQSEDLQESSGEEEMVRFKSTSPSSSSNVSEDEDKIEATADYSRLESKKETESDVEEIEEDEEQGIEEDMVKEIEEIPEQEEEERKPEKEEVHWKAKKSEEKNEEVRREEEKEAYREQKEADEEKQKETVEELFGKNSQTTMPEITVHKSGNSRNLILWALTMIAVAVGVGGGLVLFTNKSNGSTSQVATGATPSPETSPSVVPTIAPTIKPVDRADIKVQVLNGGGLVGAGSKMKSFLEEKGYTVSDVGNASSYSYEETEVNVKQSVIGIRDTIEQDLSEDYTVGKIETTLPESSQYDVRVTVGKK